MLINSEYIRLNDEKSLRSLASKIETILTYTYVYRSVLKIKSAYTSLIGAYSGSTMYSSPIEKIKFMQK